MSSTSSTPATTPEENEFNSFYFWRVPIPDVCDEQDDIVGEAAFHHITTMLDWRKWAQLLRC